MWRFENEEIWGFEDEGIWRWGNWEMWNMEMGKCGNSRA
jgi:hypothetical protein